MPRRKQLQEKPASWPGNPYPTQIARIKREIKAMEEEQLPTEDVSPRVLETRRRMLRVYRADLASYEAQSAAWEPPITVRIRELWTMLEGTDVTAMERANISGVLRAYESGDECFCSPGRGFLVVYGGDFLAEVGSAEEAATWEPDSSTSREVRAMFNDPERYPWIEAPLLAVTDLLVMESTTSEIPRSLGPQSRWWVHCLIKDPADVSESHVLAVSMIFDTGAHAAAGFLSDILSISPSHTLIPQRYNYNTATSSRVSIDTYSIDISVVTSPNDVSARRVCQWFRTLFAVVGNTAPHAATGPCPPGVGGRQRLAGPVPFTQCYFGGGHARNRDLYLSNTKGGITKCLMPAKKRR